MTDEEREAMRELDEVIGVGGSGWSARTITVKVARTLKAMLSRPAMPEEPTPEALNAMRKAFTGYDAYREVGTYAECGYRALYAHLTKPMTKTGYRVLWTAQNDTGEYGPYDGVDEAARQAQTLLRKHPNCVVTITPHEMSA